MDLGRCQTRPRTGLIISVVGSATEITESGRRMRARRNHNIVRLINIGSYKVSHSLSQRSLTLSDPTKFLTNFRRSLMLSDPTKFLTISPDVA